MTSATAGELDRTFAALSDPTRRAILAQVQGRRRAVGELAQALEASQQSVSHHLKVLSAAGLVTGTREGTRHLFAVRVEGLAIGRQFFEDFWPDRLVALKRAVESAPDRGQGVGVDG